MRMTRNVRRLSAMIISKSIDLGRRGVVCPEYPELMVVTANDTYYHNEIRTMNVTFLGGAMDDTGPHSQSQMKEPVF